MKYVLAYGDSNTWGWNPENCPGTAPKRFPDGVRWTGVAQAELGDDYAIITQGLNGRTTVWDDPIEEYRNGKLTLVPALLSAAPVDLIVIMLGTNDLKRRFGVPAYDIAQGAKLLCQMALGRADAFAGEPRVLLVCPPPLAALGGLWSEPMFGGGEAKSKELPAHFEAVAEALGIDYLNAGDYAASSPLDGIHLPAESHARLGRAIARKVRDALG